MEIIVRERYVVDQFKVVDYYKPVKVDRLAFKQGELFYFKKNKFEYVVVGYDPKENVYYL